MYKSNNKNRGITLIALVITIIVMLIIVAVTISLSTNGGLFNYAGKAAKQTNEAIKNEKTLGDVETDLTTNELIDIYTDGAVVDESLRLKTFFINNNYKSDNLTGNPMVDGSQIIYYDYDKDENYDKYYIGYKNYIYKVKFVDRFSGVEDVIFTNIKMNSLGLQGNSMVTLSYGTFSEGHFVQESENRYYCLEGDNTYDDFNDFTNNYVGFYHAFDPSGIYMGSGHKSGSGDK